MSCFGPEREKNEEFVAGSVDFMSRDARRTWRMGRFEVSTSELEFELELCVWV